MITGPRGFWGQRGQGEKNSGKELPLTNRRFSEYKRVVFDLRMQIVYKGNAFSRESNLKKDIPGAVIVDFSFGLLYARVSVNAKGRMRRERASE